MVSVVAFDLGASSGRVLTADVSTDRLALVEDSRTTNAPVRLAGRLHWKLPGPYRGVLDRLPEAGRRTSQMDSGVFASVGVDSWAVDCGLLASDGGLLGLPVHHRDGRTLGASERVHAVVPAQELRRNVARGSAADWDRAAGWIAS